MGKLRVGVAKLPVYTVHPKVHAPATVPLRSSPCDVGQTAVLWGTSQNYYHGRLSLFYGLGPGPFRDPGVLPGTPLGF